MYIMSMWRINILYFKHHLISVAISVLPYMNKIIFYLNDLVINGIPQFYCQIQLIGELCAAFPVGAPEN